MAYLMSEVTLYLGSPIKQSQDLSNSKAEGFVPYNQHVNLRRRERIYIELMMSDRKVKASRDRNAQ